jgi:protein involved in polysaccharide export with SLBB domain
MPTRRSPGPRSAPRPSLFRVIAALGLGLAVLCAGCRSTQPDKRLLQYLNDSGFGSRYTGNSEEQNYVTIGDSIMISDAFQTDLETLATVDIDGTIVLPPIGAVHVAGMTRSDLEAFLLQKLSPYYEQLDLEVRIVSSTTGKFFFVFGEVTTEGQKPFPGDLTVFQAVTAAVPKSRTANMGRIRLIRADPRDPMIIYINMSDMVARGDSTFNVLVQERDIIYVPPTILAQLGYFLSDLLFPVTQVFREISSSLYFLYPGSYGYGYGGGGGGGGIF